MASVNYWSAPLFCNNSKHQFALFLSSSVEPSCVILKYHTKLYFLSSSGFSGTQTEDLEISSKQFHPLLPTELCYCCWNGMWPLHSHSQRGDFKGQGIWLELTLEPLNIQVIFDIRPSICSHVIGWAQSNFFSFCLFFSSNITSIFGQKN